MTDKVGKVSVLLQALSRFPGLGFLADTDRQMREAAESVDGVGDALDDMQRQAEDVRSAAGQVVASEED